MLQRIAPEIAELGGYVRTGAARRSTGVTVQQAVGRLFFDKYAATEESYAAARTLQTWLSAGPLRAYWLKRSGALRARWLVVLAVESARQQSPDPGFAFFASDAWNRCPAHSIVPALLAEVWQAAKTDTGGHA